MKLIASGVKPEHSFIEKNRIENVNKFCLFCVAFSTPHLIGTIVYHLFIPFVLLVVIQGSFWLAIFFNRHYKYNISRAIIVFITNASVLSMTWYFGIQAGYHLYLFTAPLFLFLLYDYKQHSINIYLAICTYILNYGLHLVIKNINPEPPLLGFNETNILYSINLVATLGLILVLMVYYVKNNQKINEDLVQKTELLELEIAKRKESEGNIRKLFDDLSQSYKRLEQFNYIVSHNLRGPVANLIGLSQIYNKENPLAEGNSEVIEHMEASVVNLDNIIKDLSGILQVNKISLQEKYEWVDLRVEIEKVLSMLYTQIKEMKANVVYDFNDLHQIYAIRSFVYSILYNLTSNALKYARPGVAPEIHLFAKKSGSNIMVYFTDNGIGIDMSKNKDKLFKLYSRLQKNIEGKGLGLYLVKSQMQMMGGKIEVQSTPHVGTQFILYFKYEPENI